jgi:hypothetical protein
LWTRRKAPPLMAIINECPNGHSYEARPITREFHTIHQHCTVCEALLRAVRIVEHPGRPGVYPPAPALGAPGWTVEPPTREGWYWYHESGKNEGCPMMALVFVTREIRYASRFAEHELRSYRDPHRVEECLGSWAGPLDSLGNGVTKS